MECIQVPNTHLHGGLSKTIQTPKSGSHIVLLPWVHSLSNFLPGFGPTSFCFGFTNCPTPLGSSIVQISANFNAPWVDPFSYFSNFTIAQLPLGHPPSNFLLQGIGPISIFPKFISCFIFLCALVFMGIHLLHLVHALSNFLGGMELLDSSITKLLQENWTKSKLLPFFTHCLISLRS